MTPPTSDTALGPGDAARPRVSVARLSWGVLAYTLLVVLFGAVVRITGSGAGCGQHWPTCQGEVVHLPRTAATAIEYTHRLTSGLSLVLVVGLAVLVFRRFPAGHLARSSATAMVVLMIVEALIGAALVLLALVGKNTSVARAAIMGAHLVNTSFLTGAMALTAWSAPGRGRVRLAPATRLDWTFAGALAATLAVSVTGALTALGDTLYPLAAGSLSEHLARDQSPVASFLERGRAIHPLVAFLGAVLIVAVARKASEELPHGDVSQAARAVQALALLQLCAGVLNVLLSAPGYMQVVHLGIASLLWVALVLLYATVRDSRSRQTAGSAS